MDHPALGQSPREAFQAGLASSGQRIHRTIPYDREFFIYTLPAPLRETVKVVPGRGVKVRYLYYWCELFRSSEIENSRVEVRYDPFDVGTACAFINGSWSECHSEYHNAFQGHSEKEVRAAAEEIRKRWKNQSQRFPVTARRLAQLLETAETKEEVLAQRLRDLEARRAQADVGTAKTTPGARAACKNPVKSQEDGQPLTPMQIYGEL
jgi:putative transposase